MKHDIAGILFWAPNGHPLSQRNSLSLDDTYMHQ